MGEVFFVYGTLKRGERLHDHLKGAKYLGRGKLRNFGLYKVSWYPGIVPEKGAKVEGELYLIDETTLKLLDQLEDEGREYRRVRVWVEREVGGRQEAWTYVYIGSLAEAIKIPSGHWVGEKT